jgi:hypothetical protein
VYLNLCQSYILLWLFVPMVSIEILVCVLRYDFVFGRNAYLLGIESSHVVFCDSIM